MTDAVFPGATAGVWLRGRTAPFWSGHAGVRRQVPSSLPLSRDTPFDLSSVTKIVATTALTATLVERGWIDWDDSVRRFFPGYPHARIRLRHLLSHTAGFVWWEPYFEQIRARFPGVDLARVSVADRQAVMREIILQVKPEADVETKAVYSDVSMLLLGFVLEEAVSAPFDVAVRDFVWRPMGLGFEFRRVERDVRAGTDERYAATENCPWRGGVLQGQVHDDNCWAMGGYGGHSGAFGTVSDVLHFAERVSTGFYLPSTVRRMWRRVSSPAGCERALGWDTPSAAGSSVGQYFSPATVGHLGFTGTSLWIDPAAGVAVALLSNRVHPSRENIQIKAFRPRFHDAIREDLHENFGIMLG